MNEKCSRKSMALRHLVVTYPVYEVFFFECAVLCCAVSTLEWLAYAYIKCLLNKSTSIPLPFFLLRLLLEVGQLCGKPKQNNSINRQTFVHALACKQTCVTPCAIHIYSIHWLNWYRCHRLIAFPKYLVRCGSCVQCAFFSLRAWVWVCRQMF